MENWLSSQHLGEHVGGSAVRSICSVSKMHVFMPNTVNIPDVVYGQNGTSEVGDPFILISVGAKRVVTAWKQTLTTGKNGVNENNLTGSTASTLSSLSFQWLSSDMPLRHNSFTKRQNNKDVSETPEDAIPEPYLNPEDNLENDWRYLDVTAFLVKEAGSRSGLVIIGFFFYVSCSYVIDFLIQIIIVASS